ncbi:MAG: hypothetical protein GF313_11625, partial [Caldithrix sp.]|nr:hypothetical protein [Caldithrix sp.]
MKNKLTTLLLIPALLVMVSFATAQDFNDLVVADEVLFNGETPEDVFFKPGRVLDDNTIWFCGVYEDLFTQETYAFRSVDG